MALHRLLRLEVFPFPSPALTMSRMQIRAATMSDLDRLLDVDGTIESEEYLHLERSGEGLATGWKLELRPMRSKLIESNALSEDRRFLLKQILTGADEGLALVA